MKLFTILKLDLEDAELMFSYKVCELHKTGSRTTLIVEKCLTNETNRLQSHLQKSKKVIARFGRVLLSQFVRMWNTTAKNTTQRAL